MKKLRDIYLALKFTISYFTSIPITFKEHDNIDNKTTLSFSIYLLPVVGLILSSFIIILYKFFEPSLYFALLCAIVYMLLYGFIHTEAIADVVDALYAKHSNGDPYKVIKEPTVGAMGLLYTGSFLILKIATLAYMLFDGLHLQFLIISMLSRSTAVYLIYSSEFRSTFVNKIKSHMDLFFTGAFLLFFALLGFGVLGLEVSYLIILTAATTLYIRKILYKNLGFLNGDVLGFNIEITELMLMIFCVGKLTGF